ncbi:hypothetical protein GY514_001241 [Escherichia coli]|nr:hypothetical protein [Escherichia coli]EFI3659077.1 hypothetical protein [Escherichia coli]EJD3144247.1 hypothetical protein [Escherichia coli]
MNIIKLESFRQIPANEELCESYNSTNIISALNKNGVTLINDMSGSVKSVRRGSQTVNTVERTGLIFTTSSYVTLYCTLPDLKKSAVQMGFRLTLGEGKKYSSSPSHITINSSGFTTPYPDEAASYYYEIFVSWDGSSYATAALYCNRALVDTKRIYVPADDTASVRLCIGGSSLFSSSISGTLMLGDMYCGVVPYGRNNSAEPDLLGSIEVRYSPVTAFTGGSAKNSLDKDIVTGLNTSDSDAGYLMLSPSLEAAQVTFGAVDNSKGDVVAVMAAVTYRSADAPNNCLAWKVKNGSHEGEKITEDGVQSDTNSWTTVSQSFMAQPGGETPFTKGELTFTAELFNQARP